MKKLLLTALLMFVILPVIAKNYDFNQNNIVIKTNKEIIISSKLNNDISSTKSSKNDVITTQLIHDCYYNGELIAPEGSIIVGKITELKRSRSITRNAKIKIDFDKIVRPDGIAVSVVAKPLILTSSNNGFVSMLMDDVKMLFMHTLSLVYDQPNDPNLMFVGYMVANNAVNYTLNKGDEITVPLNTKFNITLKKNLRFIPYKE